MSDHSYSASCPICGYEHDFLSKREMEREWLSWTMPIEIAMNGLSVVLTKHDKGIIRNAVGLR
jgi:hypothetical protein